jgi:hypothetical protein
VKGHLRIHPGPEHRIWFPAGTAVDAVDPVAALNNDLLPLWMVAIGIGLLRAGVRLASPIPAEPGGAVPSVAP